MYFFQYEFIPFRYNPGTFDWGQDGVKWDQT